MLPEAAHAREVVFELRKLDLELALGAHRVLGEDVEDQLRPVDDARRQPVLEAALLRGRQLAVDEQRLRARFAEGVLELAELPLADVGPLVRPRALLHELRDRLDSGRARELPELPELLVGIDPGPQHGDDEPPLGLRARSGVRLVLSHD